MSYITYNGRKRIRRWATAGIGRRVKRNTIRRGVGAAWVRQRAIRRAMYLGRFSRIGTAAYLAYRGIKWLRHRRKQMAKIGQRPGTSTAKTAILTNQTSPVTYLSRQIYQQSIAELSKTTTNAISNRQRDIANLRGVKFCWEMQNQGTRPIWLTIAICSPKKEANVTPTDWFRDWSSTRSVNAGTVLTSNDWRCRPINTDEVDVMWQKRIYFKENSGSDFHSSSRSSSYRVFDKYIPINRQFQYDNTAVTPTNRDLFVVWYYDQAFIGTGGAQANNILRMFQRTVLYWREPTS